MELIRLEQVTKTYSKGESVTPIRDLDMSVQAGEFIIISGESGIGKSTLLMMMGALLAPSSGEIFYKDEKLSCMSAAQRSKLRKENIGYIFQQPQFVQALTVKENLELVAGGKSIDDIIEKMGLADCQNNLPHQLSGGQKRRLAFAVTFLRDPEVLLADEPTNDLDEEWSEKIMRLLKEQTDVGKAVVLVTHSKVWDDLADTHYVVENGALAEA